ncbi:hypothetical protein [Streptomonospora litoralis]|uniref:Sulfotransferase family protein n=1 Tax=Streptomonospora litoralis TaxID=2498135 RepID=A0A4P6QBG8_9ACTN|nr:hypothetical protein [Streptomonospora litoralis]QBI56787.1 hypothetical protein EKD16_25230 [Streptomonospora litoralis]
MVRRVFVLCTGRCGSVTLARALQAHVLSHTVGHESRAHLIGPGRLDYPEGHVEVDNRLSWFLGELGKRFGDEPTYVHLTRDPEQVAASYARRYGVRAGIAPAYASGIIRARSPRTDAERLAAARAYVRTVTANIEAFLADKTRVVHMGIAAPEPGLSRLWDLAELSGDRLAAADALEQRHNAS